jgi:hypothetical protein
MELARFTDHRGRERRLILTGDLVLDVRRGSRTRVVADLRAPAASGARRTVEQIVKDHTRRSKRSAVLLRTLQPGELEQREREGQLRLPIDESTPNAA